MSHHAYVSTIPRESAGSSTRSSSRSSISSKKSISSVVSHSHANIRTDNWARKVMKYTTGVPPSKSLSLRKTQVNITEGTYDYEEEAMVYIDSYYFTYAWVSPSFDDDISTIGSRSSSSRSSGRNKGARREGRPASPGFGPASPIPQPHPPHHSAGFVPSPPHTGPYITPGFMGQEDYMGMGDGMGPGIGFMGHVNIPPPPPPGPGLTTPAFAYYNSQPPPPPAPMRDSGGDPGFIDLNAQGGGGGIRRYDDWA
ncbi:hypothetical protein SODALDRAFT_321012 [Sodiomyces alkalinus F11]|uniref:Uncharacterized protein n=1 Tax=Sodiomyces alkalinus (strain CBS 110278 / VKM F-3762 / F11) TaxID=1314773 RepID=A0A3N2PKG4_SODAK|nr:hypothetical protein SODALDRAFT_321012 [Sodiomyces alkalinus F11]ROT34910.1 hypothetical protein SODALDRAFT_321012 [Sodiomyces alkalinus F11]